MQYLRDKRGMSFPDACRELGIDLDNDPHEREPVSFSEQVARDNAPPDRWQETGKIFVERAQAYLWHPRAPEGRAALAYLRARGLTDETIKRARLGYCPATKDGSWYADSFAHWGIDPATVDEEKRARGTIVIAPGIVIPWFEGERLWKIAIKRPGVPKPGDYGQVLKSAEGLYNAGTLQFDRPAMLVESEFCALSVQQEAGDIITCVATGSTTRARRARWIADLSLASFVLQSFDADAAGDFHAGYWLHHLPQAMRWRPWANEWSEAGLRFKDPNDILREQEAFKAYTGSSLRGWVEQGIETAQLPAPLSLAGDEQVSEANWQEYMDGLVKPRYDEAGSEVAQSQIIKRLAEVAPVADEPVIPDDEAALRQYAETISRIVDVFGGPDRVTIQKHEPGLTLKEYVRRQRWTWARGA